MRINIDRNKANDLGLTMQQIGNTLALMLGGNYVNWFNLQGRSYEVIPQVPRSFRLTPELLSSYYVPSLDRPADTAVDGGIDPTATDPNALTHYNQLNSATFQAVPMPGVTVGQAVDFLERQAKLLPAGFSHDYLADSRQFVQEGNQLAITFFFALIIIFLVLAAQFESLRDPLVIMISVPMAISRRAAPAVLRGRDHQHLHPGRARDADRAYQQARHPDGRVRHELQIKEGLDRRAAIEMAARVRLRPILMTTAAMVTGLIPLLLATAPARRAAFPSALLSSRACRSAPCLRSSFCRPSMWRSPRITAPQRRQNGPRRSPPSK